jgi:hypothetical protein
MVTPQSQHHRHKRPKGTTMRNVTVTVKRALVVVVALTTIGTTAGCDDKPTPDQFDTPTAITTRALLDLDNAAITFPLDQFQMSWNDIQTVLAAQQIVFARCVTGSDDVSAVTVKAAQQTLQEHHGYAEWLWGYWDASYVSAHGIGTDASGGTPIGQGLTVDHTTAMTCAQSQPYLDLSPLRADYLTSDQGSTTLSQYWNQAYDKTVADPRFRDLMKAHDSCLEAKGYTVSSNGASFDAIVMDPSWTSEQALRAAVAEATCSDDAGYTQQVADLNATYQQQYIDAHHAELVATQQQVTNRVAQATQILKDAGVS